MSQSFGKDVITPGDLCRQDLGTLQGCDHYSHESRCETLNKADLADLLFYPGAERLPICHSRVVVYCTGSIIYARYM